MIEKYQVEDNKFGVYSTRHSIYSMLLLCAVQDKAGTQSAKTTGQLTELLQYILGKVAGKMSPG